MNSGVVTLEELIDNGEHCLQQSCRRALPSPFPISWNQGIADIAALATATLVDVNDLATGYLDDLGVTGGIPVWCRWADWSAARLLDLEDLGLDNLNIAELIESGLADLGDLARESLIGPAQMAIDELLASEVTPVDWPGSPAASIGPGSIIDLDALLADVNLPIKLHHLIYFGIIDHDDVRPLGEVDADVLTNAKIIDTSLLERYSLPELIAMGYITIADLVDLGELERADLKDLPVADLDAFGFSQAVMEAWTLPGTLCTAPASRWRTCSPIPK